MKSFNRLLAAVFLLTGMIFIGANLFLRAEGQNSSGRMYRVEIARLAGEISRKGYEAVSLSGCQHVHNIERLELTGSFAQAAAKGKTGSSKETLQALFESPNYD